MSKFSNIVEQKLEMVTPNVSSLFFCRMERFLAVTVTFVPLNYDLLISNKGVQSPKEQKLKISPVISGA